jgi:protease-4
MNFQLVSALMRDVWLIPQDIAETYYHSLAYLLAGKQVDFEFNKFNVTLVTASGEISAGQNPDFNAVQPGAIAVFPVSGPLMKNDQMCGPVGMKSMGQMIADADANDNIKGIILNIESPGGQAQGTQQLAEIVSKTKKPVVAYVDGMAASAAYWIASAADRIVAEPKSNIGSIGTMTSFADVQPALELQGVKFHKIVSDQTPDKNALIDQVRQGNYDQFRKEVLNPLAQDFIDGVKTYRPNIEPKQLTGKTFYAENVVGTMIDQVGNFQDAVKAVNEILNERASATLSTRNKEQGTRNTKQTPNISTNMKHYPNISQALGVELQTSDEGADMNHDLLAALETALQDRAPKQEPAKPAEPAPQPAKVDPAIEQLQQTVAALQQQLTDVLARPGAEPAKAITSTDPGKHTESGVVKNLDPQNFLANMQAVREAYL